MSDQTERLDQSFDATQKLPTAESGRALAAGRRVFFNRYTLESLAGRGGMGEVWRARDEQLHETLALKFLPEGVTRDPVAVDELKSETRRVRRLRHPNIVVVYGFERDQDMAAVSMEFIEGVTLAHLRLAQPGKVFPVDKLAPLVRQFCGALEYAHQEARVVHRDLKPANLLVGRDGNLKVADFGIARSLTESATRISGKSDSTCGTLPYMSPQQLMGDKPTAADDIYALGATLYELLTSKPPFHRGDGYSLMMQIRDKVPLSLRAQREELEVNGPGIPAVWEEVIRLCLAKDAARRPVSAAQVGALLGVFPATTAAPSTPCAESRKQTEGKSAEPIGYRRPEIEIAPRRIQAVEQNVDNRLPPRPDEPAPVPTRPTGLPAEPPLPGPIAPEVALTPTSVALKGETSGLEVAVDSKKKPDDFLRPARREAGDRPPEYKSGSPKNWSMLVSTLATLIALGLGIGYYFNLQLPADERQRREGQAYEEIRAQVAKVADEVPTAAFEAAAAAVKLYLADGPPKYRSEIEQLWLGRSAAWSAGRMAAEKKDRAQKARTAILALVGPFGNSSPVEQRQEMELAVKQFLASAPDVDRTEVGKLWLERAAAWDAAARAGSIIVKSNPAGAAVSVDGSAPRSSPATFESLTPGKHSIVAKLTDFQDYIGEAEVTERQVTSLEVTLVKYSGAALIESIPTGLTFSLTNAEKTTRGTTPAQVPDLPEGEYVLVVARDGWPEHRQSIRVSRKQVSAITALFAGCTFEVISLPPGAEVLEKGKIRGTTPFVLADVAPGQVEFEFRLTGYLPKTVAAEGAPGGRLSLEAKMEPVESQPTPAITASIGPQPTLPEQPPADGIADIRVTRKWLTLTKGNEKLEHRLLIDGKVVIDWGKGDLDKTVRSTVGVHNISYELRLFSRVLFTPVTTFLGTTDKRVDVKPGTLVEVNFDGVRWRL